MTDHQNSSAATEEEERLARAIRKARDFDPDTLYQHLGDDYPIDSTDSQGRTFYKSWRKELPSVRAVLAAQSGGVAQPAQGCGDPSCQDPNCDYGKQDDALRAEVRSLRIDNARLRDRVAICGIALAAQPPAAPVETKSAPVESAPHNSGERSPSSDAASTGADTRSSAATEAVIRRSCHQELADAIIAALAAVPQTSSAGNVDAIGAAQFLLDRLDEFDPGDDEPEREYHGHVAPAIARLRSALTETQPQSVSVWQPIETAPIGAKPHDQIFVGFMGQFHWLSFVAFPNGINTSAPGYAKPTHWTPIPAPQAVTYCTQDGPAYCTENGGPIQRCPSCPMSRPQHSTGE